MVSERWLIVGLGNPGSQYERTRHNVGFMALHRLGQCWGIAGKGQVKFNAVVGTGHASLGDGTSAPVVLAQPTTFMNLSGESVSRLMQFYQIPSSRLLVIYDEAALPLGKIRVRPDGSDAGHNGIKSIVQMLGGEKRFVRLRIGIGAPEGRKSLRHHVLERFDEAEQAVIERVLEAIPEAVACVMNEGVQAAMSAYNGARYGNEDTEQI